MTLSPARLDTPHDAGLGAPLGDLRRLVRRYAANPNLSALLADTGERTWARLAGDARSDVWLISWPEGTETGWHDHGDAAGAFGVAAGVLVEETWALGAVQRRRLVEGEARSFGRHHVHNVRGAGPGRALTVHAYAPGLVTMGGYDLTSGGPVATATTTTEESW
jgi:hypothetical protein